MTDSEKIEQIRTGLNGWCDAELRFEIEAILSPPKPLGFIDADNLPEVGTVFVSEDGGRRTIVAVDSTRVGYLSEQQGLCWAVNTLPISMWNDRMPLIIKRIPPTKPVKPKSAGVEVEVLK